MWELGRGAGITFVGGFEAQQVADTVGLEQEPHLVLGADDEVGDGGAREAAKKTSTAANQQPGSVLGLTHLQIKASAGAEKCQTN